MVRGIQVVQTERSAYTSPAWTRVKEDYSALRNA